MTCYIALIRAVNVGGTGKLPMSELKSMCEALGFADVRTWIASGNVLFNSKLGASAIKKKLEQQLHAYAGKPVGVLVRNAAEMSRVWAENPFPDAAGNRVVVIFLDDELQADALDDVRHRKNERLVCGKREIYVHYGDAMADSRLVIPVAKSGTARNINTVAKLVELSTSG